MMFRQIHRYISLVFAALWIFQAATGCLVVFRWELDNALVKGPAAAFDATALGRRLDALAAQPGTEVSSMWSSNAEANRFDIFYSSDGKSRTLRVDGAGAPLRDRSNDHLGDGNIFDRLSELHMALMLGDAGRWFLGLSGIVLISNIIIGLKLAWPRAGQWLKALRAPKAKSATALLHGWHRAAGLWLAFPALVTIAAGIVLAFDGPLTALLKADVPSPIAAPEAGNAPIAPSAALAIATARYPQARLSGFSLPRDDAPWYKVRVRVPGEMPRIWGMTTVFISVRDGAILSTYDARAANGPARFLLDLSYPLHTGQIGWGAGRIAQLLIGLWLIAMAGLGISLWASRKSAAKTTKK